MRQNSDVSREAVRGLSREAARNAGSDGSLLDHVILLYGSASAAAIVTAWSAADTAAWRRAGTLKRRHLVYPDDTPLANLQLTLLNKVGVPAATLGDSTGQFRLSELSSTLTRP